ncbi:MAG: MFS transporter, partial [Actinomycetota bacterium]
LYWFGVVFSQIGTRGTIAAQLYHVFQLTDSTFAVGLVGLSQFVALLVLSPLGGAYADRLDRRRLLQVCQALSMLVGLALAILTITDSVQPWHIYLTVVLHTSAQTFDQPARQALIPAMVPREQLVHAFALLNPSREVAILVGPAFAGLLIALQGPEAMYVFDAVTYAALVLVLAVLHIPRLPADKAVSLFTSIREGVSFLRTRPIIYQLMVLDMSATVFGAYRVLLPAISRDILEVGPTVYGLLAAAPSAGALIGSALIFKLNRSVSSGHIILGSTVGYGLGCMLLAQAPAVGIAFAGALALGAFDALATTMRHAAVQLETPDEIRGRVSSLYQMASRGGPAIGDLNIGLVAGVVGPVAALTLGGLVPIGTAMALALRGGRVREYRGAQAVS